MGNFFSDLGNQFAGAVSDLFNGAVDIVGSVAEGIISGITDGIMSLFGLDDILDQFDKATVTKTGSVQVLPVVYGKREIGGIMVDMEVSGSDNKYLWATYALCDSGSVYDTTTGLYVPSAIEAIDYIVINEDKVDIAGTPGSSNGFKFDKKYEGQVLVEGSLGDHTTQPFPTKEAEVAKWTADHLMIGTACISIRFKWDSDVGVFSSLPTVRFVVRGQKILDLAAYDGSDASRSYRYSQNPAECLFDYLTNQHYGKALSNLAIGNFSTPELDLAAFKTVATYSDNLITPYYNSATTHKRFACNALMDSSKRIVDNVKGLLKSCRSTLPHFNGTFSLVTERHYLPSEYSLGGSPLTSYFDFNVDNIIGSWSIASGDTNSRYNSVKVTYANEDKNYTGDFAVVSSSTFRAEDGRLLEKTIQLPTVTNYYRAIDTASVILRLSRQQIKVSFLATPEALKVSVGSVVTVTHPSPGWAGKQFRVTSLLIRADGNVKVELSEHEATVYDLTVPNEVATLPDTNLSDPRIVAAPTNLVVTSGTQDLIVTSDGTIVSRMHVNWTASLDVFVNGYEVEYKNSLDSIWLIGGILTSLNSTDLYISNVVDGQTYDIRIRARNSAGHVSGYLQGTHTAVGKTAPPEDVTGFTSALRDNSYTLKWASVSDLDLSHYEVKAGSTYVGAVLLGSTKSTQFVLDTIASGTTTYWIKAVDTTGNNSATEASTQINITQIPAPTGVSYTLGEKFITVSWTPSQGSLPTKEYNLYITHPVRGKELIGTTDGTKLSSLLDWDAGTSGGIQVAAVDTMGNEGILSTLLSATIARPSTPTGVSSVIADTSLLISWNPMTATSLPIAGYRVEVTLPNTSVVVVGTFNGTKATHPINWLSNGTSHASISIIAIDVYGNESIPSSGLNAPVTAPSIPVFSPVTVPVSNAIEWIGNIARIAWTPQTGSFPISHYSIRAVDTVNSKQIPIGDIKTTSYDFAVTFYGDGEFYVKAWDINGNPSPEAMITTSVTAPSTPIVTVTTDGPNFLISWGDAKGTLPIESYTIAYRDDLLTDMATAITIGETKSLSIAKPADSIIQRNYLVKAVDVAGNSSPVGYVSFTPSAPSAITMNLPNPVAVGNDVTLSWNDVATDFPIVEYVVKRGATFGTALEINRTKALSLKVTGDWSGSQTFWVAAVDVPMNAMNASAGNTAQYGVPSSRTINLSAPSSLNSVTQTFTEGSLLLNWADPASDLPISHYKITRGAARVVLSEGKATSFSLVPDWSGTETIYITSVNSAGAESAEYAHLAVVTPPNAPTISAPSIIGDRIEFTWDYANYTGSLPPISYDIRYDGGSGTFANATQVLITGTDSFSRKVDWVGNRRFLVAAIDSSGNTGTEGAVSKAISAPIAISILPQVIDNNVLLRWSDASSTLPISHYEVRKGATYGTSTDIGSLSGLFFTSFETVSDTYTYWVTGVDTAGNLGVNNSITTSVSEPPDYVLYGSGIDPFDGTKTNTLLNSEGNLNMPVNLTETFAQHFTGNSWTSPNDQVAAGFPIYIEPTPSTASYSKVFDLGTLLANLSVTFNITSKVIDGNLVFATSGASYWTAMVSISTDGATWLDFPKNNLKAFGNSFRYIKITIDVNTDSGDDLLEISNIDYVIDVKERSDSGRGTAATTDANGTAVTFNKSFVDISSIVVTPTFGIGNSTNVSAVYDFLDAPNPTTFYVYLFDTAGARVNGDFTWNARGR